MRWVVFFAIFLHGLFVIGQDEEIRVKQRAIFIYNFARQVVWQNDIEIEQFSIGVLGEDPVLQELGQMRRQGRTIRGRPIWVRRIQRLSDVGKFQLVYLNKKYNYEIDEVLQVAKGNRVLVVSEGYGFNESMINIIETPDGFQFELNETRLNVEGFVLSDGLRRTSITTAERWQELYQASSESLEAERLKNAEQQAEISKQDEVIGNLNQRINDQLALIDARNVQVEDLQVKINAQNDSLNKLLTETVTQQEAFAAREAQQRQLEQAYEEQIADKQKEVEQLDKTLKQQRKNLELQESQLADQIILLREQRRELNAQEWFTVLFAILATLSLLTVFFIWRGYRIKRKTNQELAVKNAEIELQAKELDQKSKEMEQFAYIASHDLQEPLNTISGSLSLIDGKQLDEVGSTSVKFIDEAINRMRKMIQGLLEHSRLGADVEFEELDANQLLESVKVNLRQVILNKRAKVTWDPLPKVFGHEVELTLLFQNLISNALKFTEENEPPMVHISSHTDHVAGEQFWYFQVKDNGIGIDLVNQRKIFGIFQRLNSRTAYEGSGIGLAHCKKIVELHGGRIWVESEVGKGSTFCFTIKGK